MLLIRTAGGWFSVDRSPSPPSWLQPVLGSTVYRHPRKLQLSGNHVRASFHPSWPFSLCFCINIRASCQKTQSRYFLQASLEMLLNVAFKTKVHPKKIKLEYWMWIVNIPSYTYFLTRNSTLMLPPCFGSSTSHLKQDHDRFISAFCVGKEPKNANRNITAHLPEVPIFQ